MQAKASKSMYKNGLEECSNVVVNISENHHFFPIINVFYELWKGFLHFCKENFPASFAGFPKSQHRKEG